MHAGNAHSLAQTEPPMQVVHAVSAWPHFCRHAVSSHAQAFVHAMYDPHGPLKLPFR